MANKKNVTVEEQIDQELGAAIDKTQDFFDKNGKTITYVLMVWFISSVKCIGCKITTVTSSRVQ